MSSTLIIAPALSNLVRRQPVCHTAIHATNLATVVRCRKECDELTLSEELVAVLNNLWRAVSGGSASPPREDIPGGRDR